MSNSAGPSPAVLLSIQYLMFNHSHNQALTLEITRAYYTCKVRKVGFEPGVARLVPCQGLRPDSMPRRKRQREGYGLLQEVMRQLSDHNDDICFSHELTRGLYDIIIKIDGDDDNLR